ncbi:anthranilate synthase component I [Haliangium ochraceum]|uniref:Anthranilate synthase component 1 n=1 Tax=Haliangium ochraceum (strain DSM 14365 / JCM 11303 / SMP-2) TaxID=502025 RepID=D0LX39_HALO1|nr:anthranilate synthase component I [Haliangium ochraceum]ACY16081.1 anthranilate synthase component I [Haliangium ochraceum DSM 14365]
MYHPSSEAFVAAAERGNLIPVYREIVADGDTPVSAYAKLGRGPYSFLLESVVGGSTWAAYSFIGVAPHAILRCSDGRAELVHCGAGEKRRTEMWDAPDPSAALAQVMSRYRPVPVAGLPRFFGGAVGWMGYEVVRAFERLPTNAPPGVDVPDLCMVLTDTLVIFDNLRQTVKVVSCAHVPALERAEEAYRAAQARIDEIVERLSERGPGLPFLQAPPVGEDGSSALRWGGAEEPESSFSREAYQEAVERIRSYILAGDIFQAVLSQRLRLPRAGLDLFDVYRALRIINPSPYMFHLAFPEATVTGASPETLVRCAEGKVDVRPIAGTRPRGVDERQDRALADELRADPKECAEHLMLVDLGRNDVGRVAEIGSVEVSEYMSIERYSHVMHMVSHVQGTLAEGLSWHDVLRAAFPAGTLSGAPKIRAMEIIDELEPHRRGIYGGAVGYVSYSGNMDSAIAIRTLVATEHDIYVQAGAGIVHDSDPKAEYEETLNKARALLRAVALARGEAAVVAEPEERAEAGDEADAHAGRAGAASAAAQPATTPRQAAAATTEAAIPLGTLDVGETVPTEPKG